MRFDELPLGTSELVAHLDRLAGSGGPVDGGWRLVLELVTSRVAATEPATLAGSEQSVYGAYDRAVGAAVRSGEIDEREATVRRVSMLVNLAVGTPDQEVCGDLVQHAEELVLRNLPLTLDEARSSVDDWRSLPIAEMRRLRDVKNLLRPLAAARTRPEHRSDALQPWVALLPSLP